MLPHCRAKVFAKSPTGQALKCIAKYWVGLNLLLTDALFAGHEAGAQNWAMLGSLIKQPRIERRGTARYITGILPAIVNGHKQSDIEAALPWNFMA